MAILTANHRPSHYAWCIDHGSSHYGWYVGHRGQRGIGRWCPWVCAAFHAQVPRVRLQVIECIKKAFKGAIRNGWRNESGCLRTVLLLVASVPIVDICKFKRESGRYNIYTPCLTSEVPQVRHSMAPSSCSPRPCDVPSAVLASALDRPKKDCSIAIQKSVKKLEQQLF
jgi:hypothetical protein